LVVSLASFATSFAMASSTNKKALDLKKQEINFFYGKIGEVESVLKEQKKMNNRLRVDVEAKIKQLMGIEAALASEKEHYRWRKETVLTDMEVLREAGNARLKTLRQTEVQIDYDIAEYDVVTEENEKLHTRYKKMIHEYASLSAQQNHEREERKQKDFDTRISLEQILRQVVKAADEDYKQKAAEKMGDEAAVAGKENLALKEAKGKWEEMCKKMVQQQQESYEVLMRARVAKEVLAATTSQQELSLAVMEQNNGLLLDEINQLQEEIVLLQNEVIAKEEQLSQRKSLKAQASAAKKAHKAAKIARKEVCSQVMNISQKVVVYGIAIIARDQKKKAAKLSMGIGNVGQQQEEEVDNEDEGEKEEKISMGKDIENTPYSSSFSETKETSFDPELVWHAQKSDIHMADALRRKVRSSKSE